MELTSYFCVSSLLSSTFSLAILTFFSYFSSILSITGASLLQKLHQGAQKSTKTACSDCKTSSSNCFSFSIVNIAVFHTSFFTFISEICSMSAQLSINGYITMLKWNNYPDMGFHSALVVYLLYNSNIAICNFNIAPNQYQMQAVYDLVDRRRQCLDLDQNKGEYN